MTDPVVLSHTPDFQDTARIGAWRDLSINGPDGGVQRFDYAHVDADRSRLLIPVGFVGIDAGQIGIGDPEHPDDQARDYTMEGDGEYPIYVSRNDVGDIERVAVDGGPEVDIDRFDRIDARYRHLRFVLRDAPSEPEALAQYLSQQGWGKPDLTASDIAATLRTCGNDLEARAYNLAESGLTPPILGSIPVLQLGGSVRLDRPNPIPTPLVGLRPGTWLARALRERDGRVSMVVLEHLRHLERGWSRCEGWIHLESDTFEIRDENGVDFMAPVPPGAGRYPVTVERTEHGAECLSVRFFLPEHQPEDDREE